MILATGIAGGCAPTRPLPAEEPLQAQLKVDLRKAATANARLTEKSRLLEARVKELTAREEQLSRALHRVNFSNSQHKSQLKALASAPAMRDMYKSECDELRARNAALTKQAALLQERIIKLKARPSDTPTAAAATR